jgi:hypothetical protein
MNRNKVIKATVLIVILIIIISAATGLYLFYKKHPDITKTKPDYKITAIELQKEFDTDEQGASQKFGNKVLEVTGTISSINVSEGNNINITLKTGNDMSSVICTLPSGPEITALKPGNSATIRGVCSGFLMDVLLNNCAIIKTDLNPR